MQEIFPVEKREGIEKCTTLLTFLISYRISILVQTANKLPISVRVRRVLEEMLCCGRRTKVRVSFFKEVGKRLEVWNRKMKSEKDLNC